MKKSKDDLMLEIGKALENGQQLFDVDVWWKNYGNKSEDEIWDM